MASRQICWRCKTALGADRILFNGKVYCSESCALPENADEETISLFNKRADQYGRQRPKPRRKVLGKSNDDEFLDEFYVAIEGGTGIEGGDTFVRDLIRWR